MMLSLGPIIFGLLVGMLIGSQLRLNVSDAQFTNASLLMILIAGIFVAWDSGNFPFYNDLPISTAFLSALIGLFVGKLLFARSK